MTIKGVHILRLEVRTMGLCLLQLLAYFSPQKKHNARGGSEHVEGNPIQYIPPEADDIIVFLDVLSFSPKERGIYQIRHFRHDFLLFSFQD